MIRDNVKEIIPHAKEACLILVDPDAPSYTRPLHCTVKKDQVNCHLCKRGNEIVKKALDEPVAFQCSLSPLNFEEGALEAAVVFGQDIGLEVLVVTFSPEHFGMALAVIPIVLVARLVAVAIPIGLLRLRASFEEGAIRILTWAGIRGGIAIALATMIRADVKAEDHMNAKARPMRIARTSIEVTPLVFRGSEIETGRP